MKEKRGTFVYRIIIFILLSYMACYTGMLVGIHLDGTMQGTRYAIGTMCILASLGTLLQMFAFSPELFESAFRMLLSLRPEDPF